MNKKYLNSILIVLLIVIWGSLIYKHFGKKNNIQNALGIGDNYVKPNYNYKMTKDTFKLKLINTNPFKVSRKIRTNSKKITKAKVNKRPVKTSNMKWPNITYHGFVKGDNKTTRLILLKINNKLYRKREKETINEVTLLKAYSDSLIVKFNDNNKTIKKIHD